MRVTHTLWSIPIHYTERHTTTGTERLCPTMGIEIERKFLVQGTCWKQGPPRRLRQGYLSSEPERTVRVRVAAPDAFLTIKGRTHGASRPEFEYPIPLADAEALLDLCQRPILEKDRYRVGHAGLVWEVDEFFGENQGLVVAEVELDDADQTVDLPPWVGNEVTDDARYFNANLIRHPYRLWGPSN